MRISCLFISAGPLMAKTAHKYIIDKKIKKNQSSCLFCMADGTVSYGLITFFLYCS